MSNVAIQSNTPLQVQTTIVPAQVGTVPGYATMQISGLVLICEAATSQVLCKMDGGGFFPIPTERMAILELMRLGAGHSPRLPASSSSRPRRSPRSSNASTRPARPR